jgi:hypothetical protein
MIDELELLRRHMDAMVDSNPNLESVRQRLEEAIEEGSESHAVVGRRPFDGSRAAPSRRRTALSLGGLVAAGVAAALVAVFLFPASPAPRSGPRGATRPFPAHLSVGDQLRLVADRAAEQPIPQLQANEALFTQASLSVVATVNNGAAAATIELSVQKVSTATGQTCTTLSAQPAQFASPATQAAWEGLGLRVTPSPPTASQCLERGGATPPDAITGAGQLINVSSLPVDPVVLARELESGSTGITALDQLLPDLAAPNPGFQRAAVLLIGPTLGTTPQFDAALYQAIALLPGVTALGPITTHDGQRGQGFASGPGSGQSTMVVDPATGQLLEVQGLDDSGSLTSIAGNYLGSGPPRVTSYGAQLQWLDPIGSPSVKSSSDLPQGLPIYVLATMKPGLTYDQALQPVHQLAEPYFSYFTSDASSVSDPSNPNSPALFEWSFARPAPVVNDFIQMLQTSGMFASVSEI